MKEFKFAIKEIIPILVSYLFIGIACGVLFYEKGYSFIYPALAGAIVYAGSMQILLVPLIASNTPLLVIFITTIFVNLRHTFYGISFLERYRKIRGWKFPYMVLTMTDETYSILASIEYEEDLDKDKVDFYILLSCHLIWILACTIGGLLGDILPIDISGIDFAATSLFVVIVINYLTIKRNRPAIFISFIISLGLLFLLEKDNFLLPAIILSAIILALKKEEKSYE